MIRQEERDYERIEPSIRGIGDQEGERGKAHDGTSLPLSRKKAEENREKYREFRKKELTLVF